MTDFAQRLQDGAILLLDGATGTELERRGADMNDAAWCAMATLSAPDLLRTVHEDYIRAGADVITTNTYASSRLMLEAAGCAERTGEIVTKAVEIALRARDGVRNGRDVAVAGSLSHMNPMKEGTDGLERRRFAAAHDAKQAFEEMAGLLAEAGCDLIILEMMYDPDLAPMAVEAATATGLPVWVGYSARRDDAGTLSSFSRLDVPFREALAQIPPGKAQVAGIMHTSVNDTPEALVSLGETWSGPVMVYPEAGYFEMPHWQFVDVIDPGDFVDLCQGWIDEGVQIVGGCCGIGIDHIEALGRHLGRI